MKNRATTQTQRISRPAAVMGHPLVVAALAVLIVNDRMLKARWPGLITGKLSDLAGLAMFPVLVVGLIEVISWTLTRTSPERRLTHLVAGLMTALTFSLIQVVPIATNAYRNISDWLWFGPVSVTPDPSDIATIPAAFAGLALVLRTTASRSIFPSTPDGSSKFGCAGSPISNAH